ncbi:MAG TPA: class I tRNA ligase family protein, partial [Opitutales bacterium]|nr:class I tRNA ligase family protein [Opitutales bacterium]
MDDYHTGLRYALEPYSPVDDDGRYVNDGKIPASLVGITALETKGRSPANEKVVELLNEVGAIMHHERYEHSYPHCWRSKTPVIYRAMDQWFISLDENGLRNRVLDAVSTVQWMPSWGENRIRGSIEARPDWCITRQRSWGVPMPVFYDENKEAYLDAQVIRAIADKIETRGTDYWFASTAAELLSGIELPESWKGKTLKPGTDTIDVWMDSGSSSLAVLQRRPELQFPADLYLEGSDQHRGWFQSSLWIAVATTGKAPYKKVLTHGFIVDENYRKISKSADKPQTAQSYVDRYGVDVLRLWASSENFQDDIPISETILNQVTQTYRTIRNTLRFQLGNLFDFDFERDAVSLDALTPLDQWALSKTAELITETTEAYDQMAYHRVYQLVNRFCNVVLSAIYHDILKDRLYVSAPQSTERRSSQTAIYLICDALVKVMAPVLSFTADEAFAYSHQGVEYPEGISVHLQNWPQIQPAWFKSEVVAELEELLKF